jgi:hypothetical protein
MDASSIRVRGWKRPGFKNLGESSETTSGEAEVSVWLESKASKPLPSPFGLTIELLMFGSVQHFTGQGKIRQCTT